MTVGELFVNLGVKGTDQSIKAINGVTEGLGKARGMAWETKLALVAMFYAVERLMSSSAKAGTELKQFEVLTGISAQKLQAWQYAARQVGVANEEVAGSIKSVQSAMTNMLLGKGAPEGLGLLANRVGFRPEQARDTLYVMKKLQEFAQTTSADIANPIMRSFGLTDGVITAMRRNAFTPEVMDKAPKYGAGEVEQLNKVNVAWGNIGNKIEMAVGHLSAKHGLTLATDISKIIDNLAHLVDSLTTLAEKLKVFEAVSFVIGKIATYTDMWSKSMDNVNKDKNGETVGFLKQAFGVTDEDKKAFSGLQKGWGDYKDESTQRRNDQIKQNIEEYNKANPSKQISMPDFIKNPVGGKFSPAPKTPGASGNSKNVTVNQTITHHGDAKDTKAVKDLHKTGVNNAVRQLNSIKQGS